MALHLRTRIVGIHKQLSWCDIKHKFLKNLNIVFFFKVVNFVDQTRYSAFDHNFSCAFSFFYKWKQLFKIIFYFKHVTRQLLCFFISLKVFQFLAASFCIIVTFNFDFFIKPLSRWLSYWLANRLDENGKKACEKADISLTIIWNTN